MATVTHVVPQNESAPQAVMRTKLVHITTVPISLNFFRGQIAYLKSRGFEVQAISSPGELLEQAARREQIEVHAVPMSRGIDAPGDVVALARLWRLLRSLRPDIVHSHTPKAGLLGTIAARLVGVRVIMLSIFGLPQMTRTGWKRRLLDATTRLSCRLAHRIWCDGESMRDYLIQEKLCSADKVVVLGHGSSNGVNTREVFSPDRFSASDRQELRARYGIPADAPVLCFVGRIVADKGMHDLADAWRLLRDHHPNMHLLLVGPFESQDPLLPEDEALFRNDERIHLAGMRDDVPLHLAASDILVNPSHREGFNVALLEGSAMSLPVVATRIPGCIDPVQEGITGLLVPPRDGLELSRAIETYLQNPELRRQHGEAGRARVVNCFQPQSIWEALEQEYLRLGS